MHTTIPALLLSIIMLCLPARSASAEGFSGARAYATLRTLAGEIGPRPMGSPAEQRALAFAESCFVAAGCDTAYVMPLTNAKGVNTTSGIAVGVLKGSSGRIIVIGGHIDSSAPEVPGANDDGSGTACVIELARVLGARDLRSTIVFACFGGEEEGLQGSTWFVNNFPQIDSVDLMLQIDMADGASYVELDPDAAFQVSAPRWLPEAAQEIYNAQRNDGNLRYLTHMATLNASTPGGTGSDHMPFLEKGIPAIDFTSDIGYPIHSPLDNLATFDSSGLERSGSLVLGLVERFDGGVPSRTTEKYYLLQYAGHLAFLSHEIMTGLSAIAVIVAVVAFNTLRRRRLKDRTGEPSLSGLKLTFFAFVIQICVWLPETLLGAVKGYRYPWVTNFPAFTLLAVIGGLLGAWLILRLAVRWRIGTDPFPLYVRSFILMFGAWFGAFMANPEIALYMAWPLFWISLAVVIRPVWFKRLASIVALYLPARLIFVEPLTLFLRLMSGSTYENAFRGVVLPDVLYVLGFGFLSLPFVFGFAAVHRSSSADVFGVRWFRSRQAVLILGGLFVALFAGLLFTSVYDGTWQPVVRIEQKVIFGTDSSSVRMTGSEGVDGLPVSFDGGKNTEVIPAQVFDRTISGGLPEGWFTYDQTTAVLPDSARPDSLVRLTRVIDLDGGVRPLSVELRYHSEKPVTVSSPWVQGSRRRDLGSTDKTGVLTWYAFPELPLRIPVTLRVARGQTVTESLDVTYDTLSVPVRVTAPGMIVRERMTVTRRDTLRAPGGE